MKKYILGSLLLIGLVSSVSAFAMGSTYLQAHSTCKKPVNVVFVPSPQDSILCVNTSMSVEKGANSSVMGAAPDKGCHYTVCVNKASGASNCKNALQVSSQSVRVAPGKSLTAIVDPKQGDDCSNPANLTITLLPS